MTVSRPGRGSDAVSAKDQGDGGAYLRIRGLTKRYGAKTVLDGIDLDVGKADLLGLLGPSGSGKSTILNVIGGFVLPDAGVVTIGGEDVLDLPPYRRDLGITFQNYALFPHLTVFDNIAFGLVQRKVAKAEVDSRVQRMLSLVSLSGYETRFPRQLSGGEQQRVALARALVVQPRLMLLDEPLANLDASLRQRVRFDIREVLRQTLVTSIFVTHDQDEAFALCDHVAVLHEGTIRQVGRPAEIVREPADSFVAGFIGCPNVFSTSAARVQGNEVSFSLGGFTATATCRSPVRAGARVDVFIRPEEIQLQTVSTSDRTPIFKVKDKVFLGSSQEVWLEGPVNLRCRVAMDDERFARGDGVKVSWNAKSARAFEADAK
jgi:ABC-type Fe3+/spermidine/putrescine transport system ATPase subunit